MLHFLSARVQRALLFLSLIKAATLYKVSYVFGSSILCFSASHAIMPLTGAFGGLWVTALVMGASSLINLVCGIQAPYFLTYHIPALFASAYWSYNHWSVRAVVPLVCMVLFVAHPAGMLAAPYALYWIIPMVVFYRRNDSIFAHSLASTFMAHAVGSVIWLYSVPMTTAQWYALMPVVAVERLLFATAMTLVYYALRWVFSWQSNVATVAPASSSLQA